MSPRALALVALTACGVVATCAVGWWGIAAVGLGWGVWSARRHPQDHSRDPWDTAVAAAGAALAWGVLLLWTAARGPLGALMTTLGALLSVGAWLPPVLALLFAALLAGSAAWFAESLMMILGRERTSAPGPRRPAR